MPGTTGSELREARETYRFLAQENEFLGGQQSTWGVARSQNDVFPDR